MSHQYARYTLIILFILSCSMQPYLSSYLLSHAIRARDEPIDINIYIYEWPKPQGSEYRIYSAKRGLHSLEKTFKRLIVTRTLGMASDQQNSSIHWIRLQNNCYNFRLRFNGLSSQHCRRDGGQNPSALLHARAPIPRAVVCSHVE